MTKPFLTIADAIRHWAQVKPDASALKAPGAEDLSYAMLKNQLDSTAKQLAALGYGADHRLALVLPQSILLASCLLTLSASSTVFPISNDLTTDELVKAYKKADASAVLISADSTNAARTAAVEAGIPVLELIRINENPSGTYSLRGTAALTPSSTVMTPDTTAFLISTSGTTGSGKLVPFTNRMFADVAALKSERMRITPEDAALWVGPLTTISFLGSCLFPVIYHGNYLVIDSTQDLLRILKQIEHCKPAWIDFSPPLLQALMNHLDEHPAGEAMKNLRFIRVGGAPFPAEKMRILETSLGVPVINAYGMTETLSGFTTNPLPPGIRKHETVGMAVHGEAGVFSEDGSLLPLGGIGELGLKGPNIFKGYFNPEDDTPYLFRNGWFMTGDLATIDKDGYITIVGRIKEMINSGGIKILPREVEEAIMKHPDVIEACVVALPHPTLGEQVAAAVVRRSNSLSAKALNHYLKAYLAAYKIPTRIAFINEIPHNPGGKVMRNEVVDSIKDQTENGYAIYSAPETEIRVLTAWEKVLGTQPDSLDEAFLAAGGDSITAIRLSNVLSEVFNVDFSAVDIFEFPTVSGQAAEFDRRSKGTT